MRVESVLKSYCILIGALIAVGYPIYLLSSQGLIDPTGEILIGRDFANYYNASQLAVTGELNRLFDIVEYRAFLNHTFGQRFELNWSYPPHFLFFALPLAGLPYLVAYGVWVCAGLGIYIGAAWRSAIERYHLRRSQVAVLLLAPATLINAFFGQNGFITGTLLYLGVRYTAQRPVLAGICFGMLTIKPQLGLLIPVMLVLTRQWLTIAVAIATAMTLIAASGAAFGMQSWVDYFEKVLPYQRGVMEEGTGLFLQMMPSVYGLGRLIGLSPDLCMLIQLPVSLFAFGLIIWLFVKPRGHRAASVLLFLLCTFMVTPYAFNYDMTALTPAILAYWGSKAPIRPLSGRQSYVVLSLFLLPGIMFALPVGPAILVSCAWMLYREIARNPVPVLTHAVHK